MWVEWQKQGNSGGSKELACVDVGLAARPSPGPTASPDSEQPSHSNRRGGDDHRGLLSLIKASYLLSLFFSFQVLILLSRDKGRG